MTTTDYLLKNGRVVSVTGRQMVKADVLVREGRIAAIGQQLEAPEGVCVLDCTGRIVAPGFVDAHVHIESSMVLPQAFGEAVLVHGTTTVIADPHEVVNVAGAEGLRQFLALAQAAPVDIYTTVPSSVPATELDTNGAGHFTADAMREFVGRPDIVGLGEVMCHGDVLQGRREILDKIDLFRDKTIDGHTAGLSEAGLSAYRAAGVQNDHESVTPDDLLQRYRAGMNVYLRQGSAARNAHDLLACVRDNHLDTSRFAFCTDDKHLSTIASEGHISAIVHMALQLGFSWPEVSEMASWNPCRYYRLPDRGDVQEGYVADLVVTDEACEHICYVWKQGRLVVENGCLLAAARTTQTADGTQTCTFKNTVHFRELNAEDFRLPESRKRVAIGLVDGQIITRRHNMAAGEWASLPRLAVVERHGHNGNMQVCCLHGYDIRGGAVATSVSHDSHNVISVGDDERDMAQACNRLKQIGGGYVIVRRGEVAGELPLPAYGLMATADAATVADVIHRLEQMTHEMGVNPCIDPFTTLSFVALPVIPVLRLLDTGLYDVVEGRFLD